MTGRTLKKSIFLKAPRDMVWAWITEPEHLAKWFHAPKSTIREGEPLEMFGATSGDRVIWGQVITARAPKYLEHTFTVKPMGNAETLVKWWLEDVPGGTQLSLEHSGLDDSEEAFALTLALDNGWDEHFMKLRSGLHPDD